MGNRLVRRDRKTVAEERVRAMIARRKVLWHLEEEGKLRVPLEEPFFWGYRREFILRADVARRRDADRLLQVLSLVQKPEDCKRKDFLVYDRQTRRWYQWHHTPKTLSIRQFQWLPEDLKCYFNLAWCFELRWRFEVTHPWMFQTRLSKLYITHRFVPDAEAEQASDYLEAKILQGQLWGIATKVKSGRNRWKKRRRPIQKWQAYARIHRQETDQALECHAQGKLGWARGKEVMQDA